MQKKIKNRITFLFVYYNSCSDHYCYYYYFTALVYKRSTAQEKEKNWCGNHNSLQKIYIDLSICAFMSNSQANHLNDTKMSKKNIKRGRERERKKERESVRFLAIIYDHYYS